MAAPGSKSFDDPGVFRELPLVNRIRPRVSAWRDAGYPGRRFRMQTIVFQTAREVFDQMAPTWSGSREILLARLVPLVDAFLASGRLTIVPEVFRDDPRRHRKRGLRPRAAR